MSKQEKNIKWGKVKSFTFGEFIELYQKLGSTASLETMQKDYEDFLNEWNGMHKDTYERVKDGGCDNIIDYIREIYNHYSELRFYGKI